MAARFPRLRPNGSFCVEVALRVGANCAEDLVPRVNSWCREWVRTNRHWEWFGERRDYFDEFADAPRATGLTNATLYLQVEGKHGAKWWKDWLALRLIKDLAASFTEIEAIESIKDCPGE